MQVFLITLLWMLLACYVEPQLHGEENAPPVPNAQTQRRLALVIGNGAYTAMPDSLQPLVNPVNDAEDIATQLSKFGFEVTLLKNGTLEAMDEAIHSFSSKIKKGDVTLLYYTGHAIQVGGENFLLPVDAKFKREDQVERQAIKASVLLDKLDNASTKLVFLDACRNNPFLVRSTRAFGRTGTSRNGLAKLPAPDGTLLVYSTDPDNVAEDGSGRNSPFTQGLLKFIGSPGVDIQLMLREVRKEVKRNTDNRQTPWDTSSLEDTFYFLPGQENQQLPVEETRLADIKSQQEAIAEAVRQSEELERQKQDYLTAYNSGDYAKAVEILSELVKHGDAYIQNNLGFMYQNGYGVTQDYTEAVNWYRKAAEQGNADGQVNLGFMYQNGYGVTQDYNESVNWCRKAAAQGHAVGQNNLGFMYQNGYGVTQNYTEAVNWYRKAAAQGNAGGQATLGFMYQNGYGVTQDYNEAVNWYHKASAQGHAGGQYNLGFMYQNGYGVTQNYIEAVNWYHKAAAQGHAGGQYNLGFMYQNGYGVTQNYTEAVNWYRKAAEQGNAGGQATLGFMYQNGYGVTQDYNEAVNWYRKAAEQGDAGGQYNLGFMYQNGYGVTQDYNEAVNWYRKAAAQGLVEAQNTLDAMQSETAAEAEKQTELQRQNEPVAEPTITEDSPDFVDEGESEPEIQQPSVKVRVQSFLADSSHRWLVVASKPTIEETQALARQYQAQYPKTTIFLSENGWYGISVGLLEFPKQEYLKDQWIKQGQIPPDSYFTQGKWFRQQIDF